MKRVSLLIIMLLLLCGCGRSELRPIDTDLHGFDGDHLYVVMDDETYLYKRQYSDASGMTEETLVDSFVIETAVEGVVWEIYTVKEHRDRTYLKAISGTNSSWIYKYCEK